MHRGALVALLLVAPLVAGCVVDEPIQVAMRVRAGDTLTLSGAHRYDGSVVVDPGATLVLDHAELHVAQDLLVDGALRSVGGSLVFAHDGSFSRHDLGVSGSADLIGTDVVDARALVLSGLVHVSGGTMRSGTVTTEGGALRSEDATWDVAGGGERGMWFSRGAAAFENGSVQVGAASQAIAVDAATVRFGNLSLDASRATSTALSVLAGGRLDLWSVVLKGPEPSRALLETRGHVSTVDTPLPRSSRPPFVADHGALSVAWTLTAKAVTLPGMLPVGGLDLTLYSGSAPGAATGSGVTDEKGEAKLVAVEYVVGAAATRSGNPHVVVADGGGKRGASPALVVEGPTSITVPVA